MVVKIPNTTCAQCGKMYYIKPSHKIKLKGESCCSRECMGEYRTKLYLGENNPNYGNKGELNSLSRGDLKINPYGYIIVKAFNHPFKTKYHFVLLHRILIEEYLRNCNPASPYLIEVEGFKDRFLDPNVIIHHINGNKLDNKIKNLKILSIGDHTSIHNEERAHLYKRNDLGQFIKNSGKIKGEKSVEKERYFDAGLDVKASENKIIKAKTRESINTDISIAVPNGCVGLLYSRSGLSIKHGIEVGAGCIDSNFRGKIKVILYNHGDKDFEINENDRIAQLLTIPINLENYEKVENLDETERGDKGFGSSGGYINTEVN